MKDEEKRNKPGTTIHGDVNTGGGDFVGRDKIVNFMLDGKTLSLPKALDAISSLVEPPEELRPKSRLSLGDSVYIVQELIAIFSAGNLLARTARAGDPAMQENVGIFNLRLITTQSDVQGVLARAKRRTQNLNLAAGQSHHLAGIRKILSYEQGLWVVSQWVSGMPWKRHYPTDGPLPDVAEIVQALTWGIDICDALAALHRFRELHGGISADTVVSARNRGAVLVDAGYTGRLTMETILPVRFDPQIDLRALGTLLYQTLTHQSDNRGPASSFNLDVPPELDALIEKIQAVAVNHASDLKRDLIRTKKKLIS
jgi:hypothetical protein